MQKYIEDGYVSKVKPKYDDEDLWYLPHRGVYKTSSAEKALQTVFDSAAKSKGKV